MEGTMTGPNKIENVVTQLSKIQGFDSSLFDQLLEDTSPDVALKILARYHETLCECLEAVEQGLADDNADQVWKACHKVAGSAELLGFSTYGKLSRKLNVDIKTVPDLEGFQAILKDYLEQGRGLLKSIESAFSDFKAYL